MSPRAWRWAIIASIALYILIAIVLIAIVKGSPDVVCSNNAPC